MVEGREVVTFDANADGGMSIDWNKTIKHSLAFQKDTTLNYIANYLQCLLCVIISSIVKSNLAYHIYVFIDQRLPYHQFLGIKHIS